MSRSLGAILRTTFFAACAFAVPVTAVAVDFTPIAGWDQQLFPSYLITTATLRPPEEENEAEDGANVVGDPRGVLGVQIESPGEGVPVTVTISADSIMEESTFTGELGEEGETCDIFPHIKYKYDALAKNKQSMPVTVTFHVAIGDDEDDEDSEKQTCTITLRSVNDCPFTITHGDDLTDVSFVFAGYVNEQHPFVDKLLRELSSDIVDSFTGYQSGDPAEVYRQVYALWNALSERDVRYSNITTSAAESRTVSSQHVRLIDESINNSQANCVDGSVLLASLLRKIDIEPVLVYVPGHCYLGFYLDAEGTQLVGLETTLIGSEAGDAATREIDGCENIVDNKWQSTNSWATFCAAVAMGNEDLAANEDKFNKDDPDCQTVSIAAVRRLGILPIAFDAVEKFDSNSRDGDDTE